MPLVFYLDGTWVSGDRNSSIKPIAMTLGNFELKLSNRDIAKRLVGYMPALQGTKNQRQNVLYKKAAAHVYHTSFAEVLASVVRVQEHGGARTFLYTVKNTAFSDALGCIYSPRPSRGPPAHGHNGQRKYTTAMH